MNLKRTIRVHTLFKETGIQSDPSLYVIMETNNQFQEMLELKDFYYGNGLQVTQSGLEYIAKIKEKRAFTDGLSPTSNEVSFN